ncbi:hypothetical protein FGG08_002396 [Glutinoglossum americanum]|uniref:Anaphase-promoting complex subunit 4 n=1 Tax=Glutinoglossum americanum TaxID=1670608 RepID=A0A9P8L4H8_9PEZI|nr:hypothetical protein FGG08_002396 [Glutinoglossum americanum]
MLVRCGTTLVGQDPTMLNLLAEKAIHQPVSREGLLAYCPTMDLLALATKEEQVFVYRLNGQLVFGAAQKGTPSRVEKLQWKPNGQLLAVTWSDSVTRLIGADSSKIIHQIHTSSEKDQNARVTCLGWGVNFTDPKGARAQIESRPNSSLDEFLGQNAQASVSGFIADLPAELALTDVDVTIPRLSVLPSGGKDEDVFNSRASVDAMLLPLNKKENDAVDVLIIASDDGTMHLRYFVACPYRRLIAYQGLASIYDCFGIGYFNLQSIGAFSAGCKAWLHSSHPYSSTHSLLVSTNEDDLYLVPLDLRFISCSGGYLSLLASKSTQLQNLLRYISQVQQHMETEWRNSQDLPSKFIRNINETLEEKLDSNLVDAAYHLVISGNCLDPMKDWLFDELTERGHKRWDRAVTTGYENIRRLAHQHLLPALERCDVLVCRLQGLSKYQDSNAALGLSTQDLSNVRDTIRCLKILTQTILNYAGIELGQFTAFSMWLRHEIDIQAAENSGSIPDDVPDKDGLIEHAKVIDYIQGAMTKSRLAEFFPPVSTDDKRDQWDLRDEGLSLFDILKKELKKRSLNVHTNKRLPGIRSFYEHLARQCDIVFKQIAEAERRNVLFGRPVHLVKGNKSSIADIRVLVDAKNGVSTTQRVEVARIIFDDAAIKDLKFVDDSHIMLIYEDPGELAPDCHELPSITSTYRSFTVAGSNLLNVTYSLSPDVDYHTAALKSETITGALTTIIPESQGSRALHIHEGNIHEFSCHFFPATEAGFVPEMLEINGRKGRRVVCVLGRDRLHYRVFDLDGEAEEEEDEDEDEGEDEEEGDGGREDAMSP